MQSQRLVKTVNTKNPTSAERGGALLQVVMAMPIMLGIAYAVNDQLQAKVKELRILRTQSRMALLSSQVENAGANQASLYQSALNAGASSRLYRCIINKNCVANPGQAEAYDLYNSAGKKIAGFHKLGDDSNSPSAAKTMRVSTTFEISCGGGSTSCLAPAEILTNYVVEQYDKTALYGRVLKPITGQASLSRFACDDNEYISGVDAAGTPVCAPARLFVNGFQCPLGGSYMTTGDGQIVCEPIVNYCGKDVAFAVVLDRSGSMNDQGKMNGAKNAANQFVDTMRNNDQSAIVSFSSNSQINSGKTKTKGNSKGAINAINAKGATNMTSGLGDAETALKGLDKDTPKVIVFLSDGQHNTGPGPMDKAEQLKKEGYRIWTIGFGKNADQDLLRRMATTPADYSFAMNAGDLNKRFEELGKAMCR